MVGRLFICIGFVELALAWHGLLIADARAQAPAASPMIVVVAGKAPVMSGAEQIATVTIGQEYSVQQVNGPWLLIAVPTPQGPKSGWLNREHTRKLLLPPSTPRPPDGRATREDLKRPLAAMQAALKEDRDDQALDPAEQCVAIAWRVFGTEHQESRYMEGTLAGVYRRNNLFPQAERFFLRTAQFREAHPGQPQRDAIFFVMFAGLYTQQGQYAQAEPLLARAVGLLETQHGPDHIEVAKWQVHQGDLYYRWGQLAKAAGLFERCVRVYETHYGRDHWEVSDRLLNLSAVYQAMNRIEEAEQLCLRALRIKEATLGPNHRDLAGTYAMLGSAYALQPDLPKAAATVEKQLRIVEAHVGPHDFQMVEPVLMLAQINDKQGDYSKAEAHFQRALRLQEAKLGPDHLEVSSTLGLLGMLYLNTHRYGQAQASFERALKIREAKADPNDPRTAILLMNMAMSHKNREEFAQAEPYYRRALAIHEARAEGDRNNASYAAALNNLAGLHKSMRQFDKAEPLYLRAAALMEATVGADHPDTALCWGCLAQLYAMRREHAKAEQWNQRSLQVAERRLPPWHPEIAANLNHLMWSYVNTDRWDEAIQAKDRASRITRYHVSRVLPGLSDREQIDFHSTNFMFFHAGQTLGTLRKHDPVAVARSAEWLLNGKGVIQASLAERALLARDGSHPESAKIAGALRQAQAKLAALTLDSAQGSPEKRRQQIAELSAEEQNLAKQLGQFGSTAGQAAVWVELDSVRQALPKDAVLIDIVATYLVDFTSDAMGPQASACYTAWVVPPAGDGDVRIVELGSASALDAAITAYGATMGQAAKQIVDIGEAEAEQRLRSHLDQVAQLALRPLEGAIGKYDRWIISADSLLWTVPWAALPLADGRYSVEAHRVSYVNSGRDLVAGKAIEASAPRGAAAIFADPDFDLAPEAAQAQLQRATQESSLAMRGATALPDRFVFTPWSPLAGTAAEARAISPPLAAYAQAAPQVYTRQNALEGRFKQLKQPRIVVLSTHGYFLAEETSPAQDQLAAGDEPTAMSIDNPLLRCGLVLAGANRRGHARDGLDDGILTGLEIVGADLRGTELVVLSACETGLGRVRNGEGVAGLRQAFQLAGAQAVVATLWPIPDRESAELMTSFFSNLAAGQSKADALRNAQLAAIKTRRDRHAAAHPLYWAAFTLTGQ